jgi:hypothetical protein
MKTLKIFVVLASVFLTLSCNNKKANNETDASITVTQPNDSILIGVWKHMSPQGAVKIHFKENGIVETDLGDNNSVDITSNYSIKSDTIEFFDIEGKSCPNKGIYKIYHRGYTVAFDVLDYLCNGRIKSTSGFWVRHNYQEQINYLTKIIKKTDQKKDILHRGRMYLALSKNKLAKKDFDLFTSDSYIKFISEFVSLLRPNLVIERFISQAPFNLLIAPN